MSKKEYEAMNINETTEYIKAYINKAAYPYAIMLNGDWGTGKSFYAKTTLTTEIKKMHLLDLEGNLSDIKMHPIYLSLYGVDSIDELARHVATEMIVNNSEFVTKARKKTTKILPVVGLGTKMVTSFLGNNILPDKKNLTRELVKLTNTFADFGKYVFIIDDLERSTIPRRQVFGFISNLVETNGAKVIVIANEKEIRDDLENKDKYMNFLSNIDKLELPEIKSESNVLERMLTPTQNASHVTKLDADSLKTLADFFSPPDEEYKKAKEKIIGHTIEFLPNIEYIIPKLAEKVLFAEDKDLVTSDYVNKHLFKCVSTTFSDLDYYNLRTAQKLILYLSKTLPIIIDTVKTIFKEESTWILNEIVRAITVIAIQESSGILSDPESRSNTLQGVYSNYKKVQYFHLSFAETYFKRGILDKEDTVGTTEVLATFAYRDSSDPLKILSNYYTMNEDDVNKCLSKLDEAFFNGEYEYSDYSTILRLKLDLESLGLDGANNIDIIVDQMCDNTKDKNIPSHKFDFMIVPQEESQRDRYINYLNRLTKETKTHNAESLKTIISNTLDNGKLLNTRLQRFYSLGEYSPSDDNSYLALIDIDKFLDVLKKSESKDIHEFRSEIIQIYEGTDSKITFPNSKEAIFSLYEKLNELLDNDTNCFRDKIALHQCTWLLKSLDKINAMYI